MGNITSWSIPPPEIWKKKPNPPPPPTHPLPERSFFPWNMFFLFMFVLSFFLEKRQTDQLNVFQIFFSNHVLEYQNTSLLVEAMLCTAANTSPVERGYTILKMVTSKCRNQIALENSEFLFSLGTLKIPVKNPENYENERKRLEKKKWTFNILFI